MNPKSSIRTMTTFYLIRHAHCEPLGKWLAGRQPGVHLTEEGLRQARHLSRRLESQQFDFICSSPLERARETAEAIAAPRGQEVRPVEAITEVETGDWTGKRFDELAADPAWERFNTVRGITRIPGGETILEVQDRMVTELLFWVQAAPDATVAFVSHADPLRIAVAYFLGMPPDLMLRLSIEPASVSVLEIDAYGARLVLLNSTG
ncbi:MAG: hypothetical protein GF331_25440 [Chitinivibrionales bacterium]|nr:hypothetical protein [Chitinivibrionales bacterium]